MPSTPADAYGLLRAAIQDPNPVVVIENRLIYGMKGPRPARDHLVPIGRSAVVRRGTDITVVSVSRMVHDAVAAAELVAGEGLSVEVIDLRTVAPLDLEPVLESVARTSRLLVAHEGRRALRHRCGGRGGRRPATPSGRSTRPVERIGAQAMPAPYAPELERPLAARGARDRRRPAPARRRLMRSGPAGPPSGPAEDDRARNTDRSV
jgi:2-oxoisovalerate dehydrogenase E1 component